MNEVIERAANPFGNSQVAARPSQNAIADSDQARSVAEVQSAMVIAKRFPRDQIAAMDRILQACARPTLAENALYSYSRGGADVTGPSIRMAEALAQAWGNVQFGIRELDQRNGESTVQAFAWDVETNTKREMTFQVPHIRHTRQGAKRLEDPRDIYEMVANQGARRLRACILGIIPGDVTEAAVKQCEVTLTTKAEVTPERLQSLLDKFAAYNVTKEMIEKRIQRRIDAMTPALLVQLGKIYNSLKDGMSTAADWFEMEAPVEGQQGNAPTSGAEGAKEKLRQRTQAKQQTGSPAPAQAASAGAEGAQDSPSPYQVLEGRINVAKDADILDLVTDEIRYLGDEAQEKALYDLAKQRRAELEAK